MRIFRYKIALLMILFIGSNLSLFAQSPGFEILSEALLDDSLKESSGLVFVHGKLWTHNDSGGEAAVYSIDPFSGQILQTVYLDNIINHDWEDIASDGFFLYIADTGNNIDGARTDLAVYKINIQDIPSKEDVTIPYNKIEIIRFYYPEQGINPEPITSNNTPFDCEAIFVVNDTIHLFTKDWTSKNAGYGSSEYIIPNKAHPKGVKYPAKLLSRHNEIGFLVTGADNWNSDYVVLAGYQVDIFATVCIRFYSNFNNHTIATGNNRLEIIGSALNLGQVEAICFGKSPSEIYFSNEFFKINDFAYPAKIKSFDFAF